MKNLCLDIGNVLVTVDFADFINGLSSKLNISNSECWYFLNRVQKSHDLGLTNIEDELRDHFKIRSESIIKELLTLWDGVIQPNYKVINSLQNFINQNKIDVVLVSNIGYEHAEYFNKQIGFKNAYRHFSCFVGARKPNLIYYQSLLQRYPQFEGAVYVDDNFDNLNMGKEMGFNTIHFDLTNKNVEDQDIYLMKMIVKEMEG